MEVTFRLFLSSWLYFLQLNHIRITQSDGVREVCFVDEFLPNIFINIRWSPLAVIFENHYWELIFNHFLVVEYQGSHVSNNKISSAADTSLETCLKFYFSSPAPSKDKRLANFK